jgi:hypothetical protein
LPEAAWFTIFGNIDRESLVDIVDERGRNALAVALRYAGPLGMLKGLGEANPPKFYSPCEVCYYIATRKKEELGQLTAESLLSAVFGETWRGMLLRSTSGTP